MKAVMLVALAVCLLGSFAAAQSGTIVSVDVYLQEEIEMDKSDLTDLNSMMYKDMKMRFQEVFKPMGGKLEELLFSVNGSCLKAFVEVRNGNIQTFLTVVSDLKMYGLDFMDQTWKVSYNGCDRFGEILVRKADSGSSTGLDHTQKVIVGVVCGSIGLLILAAIVYFVCARQRNTKKQVPVSGNTNNYANVYGQGYIENELLDKKQMQQI